MRVSVGGTLTITGTQLQGPASQEHRDLPRRDGRTAFAKPRRATRTQARRAGAGLGRAPPDGCQQQPAAHAPQAARARRQVQQVHARAACRRWSPALGDGPGGGGRPRRRRRLPRRRLRRRPAVERARGSSSSSTRASRTPTATDRGRLRVPVGHGPEPLPGTRRCRTPASGPYPNALDPGDGSGRRHGLRRRRPDAARGVPRSGWLLGRRRASTPAARASLGRRSCYSDGTAVARSTPPPPSGSACGHARRPGSLDLRRRRRARATTSATPTPTAWATGTSSAAG